jgi:hypothetical protein
MSQFWTASAVTTTSGSSFISVQTGDDVALISPNSFLQVGNAQFVEVKTVNTSATPQTIELFVAWNAATASGQSAICAPTKAEIKAAADEIRALRVTYEGIAANISQAATAGTIVQRDSNSRIKIAAPVANEDAVNLGFLGTAATRNVTTSSTDTTTGRVLKVGDFGLGSTVASSNAPLSSTLTVGFYSYSGSDVDRPTAATNGGAFVVVRHSTNFVTQMAVVGSSTLTYIRNSGDAGVTFSGWVQIFTTGNSVNPLDYGIGVGTTIPGIGNFNTADFGGLFRTFGNEAGTPLNSSIATVLNMKSSDVLLSQLYMRGEPVAGTVNMFARGGNNNTGSFTDWAEIYHSLNTNFDVFGGNAANDVILKAIAANSSVAVLHMPLVGVSVPISVTSTGTFKLSRISDGVDVTTGIVSSDISINTLSSNRICRVNINNCTGLVANITYELKIETLTSNMRVNF